MPALPLLPLLGCAALAAADAGGGVPPPQHPHLAARFEFLGPAIRVQPIWNRSHDLRVARSLAAVAPGGAAEGSRLSTLLGAGLASFKGHPPHPVMEMSGFPDGAGAIGNQYSYREKLGQGSFAAVFKAIDRKTNQIVAVKVLMDGTQAMTGRTNNPFAGMSATECVDMQKIARRGEEFKEKGEKRVAANAKRVLNCTEDHVSTQLEEKSMEPLYIVLPFVGGASLQDWWLERVAQVEREGRKGGDKVEEMAGQLRNVIRQLLEGLEFMTHKALEEKWIHHDLKPENIQVNEYETEPGQVPELTIIDMGAVLSSKEPSSKSVCTPLYRPPAFVRPIQEVGFEQPPHSFDIYSAATSIVALAGAMALPTPTGPTYVPMFAMKEMVLSLAHNFREGPRMIVEAASTCMDKAQAGDLQAFRTASGLGTDLDGMKVKRWAAAVRFCIEGWDQKPRLKTMLSNLGSGSNRQGKMAAFVGCGVDVGNGDLADKMSSSLLTPQLLKEWEAADFSKVLASMLSPDPADRPDATQVLDSAWLAPQWHMNQRPVLTLPVASCNIVGEIVAFLAPVAFVLLCLWCSSVCSFTCCCCCWPGCTPPGCTGVILLFYLLGSAVLTSVWLPSGFSRVLVVLSAIGLGVGVIATGQKAEEKNQAYMASLGLAIAFFLILVFTSFIVLAPVRKHVTYLNTPARADALNEEMPGLFPPGADVSATLTFFQNGVQQVSLLLPFVSLFPMCCGVCAGALGMARAKSAPAGGAQAARAPQMGRQAWEGVEMPAVAAPMPAPVVIEITCPEGAGPGSKIRAQAPDGRVVEVEVPVGVVPGQKIQAQV